jgi:hypothetical protein
MNQLHSEVYKYNVKGKFDAYFIIELYHEAFSFRYTCSCYSCQWQSIESKVSGSETSTEFQNQCLI